MIDNIDKKKSPVTKIVIVVISVLAVVVLFPRRKFLLDGGTVKYLSIGRGAVYEIECRHRLYAEDGKNYYEVGTIISVFKNVIFNNVHVDYDHWTNVGHSPEVESIDEELSILYSADQTQ